jgi:hypothetical protein
MPIVDSQPRRTRAARGAVLVVISALVLSCREDLPSGPSAPPPAPSLAISDAAHGGKSHFYFLPPLLPAPSFSGLFDATLSPEVRVCRLAGSSCGSEIAAFTASTSPAVTVDPVGEAYKLVWQTKGARLLTTETYRIRVLVGPVLLGFGDLQVVAGNKDLEALPADVFGLVQDKTLQIKVRIEQGAVGNIRVAPGSDEVEVRRTLQYQVLYFDLHGQLTSGGGPVQWSSSDPSVLSIDGSGLATGQSLGGAVVTAGAEGLTAKAPAKVYRKIAFVSNRDGNDEIYLIRSTGNALQRLTNDAGTDTDPSWSPDGNRIAFTRSTAAGARVFVMNADGSGAVPLSASASLVQDQRPRWSPDGQKIAFRRDAQSAEAGLYVIGPGGGGQARVTGAFDWYSGIPYQHPISWSPGSDRLTFVRANNLYVVNANGTGEAQIAPGFPWARAEWAPSARILGLRGALDEEQAINVLTSVNPDGTGPIAVTPASLQPLEIPCFAWSPAATRVAYSNFFFETGEISTIAASGDPSSHFTLTQTVGLERTVQEYSADGKALVFTQRDNELFPLFQIWVINTDGSGELALARSATSNNAVPAWRP